MALSTYTPDSGSKQQQLRSMTQQKSRADSLELVSDYSSTEAPVMCSPIFEAEQKLPSSAAKQEPEANNQEPTTEHSHKKLLCNCANTNETAHEYTPNYWEIIMIRHAGDLDHLPVPPKDFVYRERKATRSTKRKDQDRFKVSLNRLLRGYKQLQLPSERDDECRRWVLQPMTEQPPEPNPGVPRITVTDPNGKTWWPKDPNAYITAREAGEVSARAMRQHHGPDSDAHWAAFQEAYRRGLDNKPLGMRPEVIHCCYCWDKQDEILEEEVRIAEEWVIVEKEDACIPEDCGIEES